MALKGRGVLGEQPAFTAEHALVDDYPLYLNTRHIKGCPESFDFGATSLVPKSDLRTWVQSQVMAATLGQPFVLVGHSINCDLRWLQDLAVDLNTWAFTAIDLGLVHFAATSRTLSEGVLGLGHICEGALIPTPHSHNAGNDAMYTLLCFMSPLLF